MFQQIKIRAAMPIDCITLARLPSLRRSPDPIRPGLWDLIVALFRLCSIPTASTRLCLPLARSLHSPASAEQWSGDRFCLSFSHRPNPRIHAAAERSRTGSELNAKTSETSAAHRCIAIGGQTGALALWRKAQLLGRTRRNQFRTRRAVCITERLRERRKCFFFFASFVLARRERRNISAETALESARAANELRTRSGAGAGAVLSLSASLPPLERAPAKKFGDETSHRRFLRFSRLHRRRR